MEGSSIAKIVDLNVGGMRFTTSLDTLKKYPESMLGAMFSGRIPSSTDTKGTKSA